MAEAIPLAELALRILILPPISRGAHLAGPKLHVQRLLDLWRVADGDAVPLVEAFRLVDDVEAITAAILRSAIAHECTGDPRYWAFASLEQMLPELRELTWHRMLAGALLVEGIKGIRGKRHRAVLPAELPRLKPDWELSRLTCGENDEFIDVRVRHAPAEPVKKTWRNKPSDKDVAATMKQVAADYPSGAQPSVKEIWFELEYQLTEEVTRKQVREAIKNHAPQLRGRRGHRSTGKSPK
jgi:hypothetical protein